MAKIEGRILSFKSSFAVGALLLSACTTTRPNLDYVLARQAFQSAKDVDSARYAPGFYHKAEESYRRGVTAYDARYYDEAIKEFRAAKSFSEKAENIARVQKQKAGEESP